MVFMIHHEGGIRPYEAGSIRNIRPRRVIESVSGVSEIDASTESQQTDNTIVAPAIQRYKAASGNTRSRQPALKASDIMKSPVSTLDVNTKITQAFELFKNLRFRHVPITEQGKIVGILSDRDLLKVAAERTISKTQPAPDLEQTTVRDIMSNLVLSAHIDTPIHEVARIMFEERIGCIPVVSDQESLVGIITRSDILRCVMNRAPIELWT